jgi:NhaP-type Na+/H+ or K+/H+ antiporter
VLHLRRRYKSALGLDDFLTLGLIALAYGVALLAHAYGFLAVFAAGLALRRLEQRLTGDEALDRVVEEMAVGTDQEEVATRPETAPVYMAQAVLGFNEQLERIGEVAVVVLVGALLFAHGLPGEAIWFVPLLLLGIRPLAVAAGLAGAGVPASERRLVGWFGIRGIGSLYYLMFAVGHGVGDPLAGQLTGLALSAVAVSVVVHGVSVTPLMARYERRLARRPDPAGREPAAG